MSIRRQLALCIGFLMLIIMGGNFVISLYQLKHQFEDQLQARAEETATTLALSMTHAAQQQDDATLKSLIDVVFDRGHFQRIQFDFVGNDPARVPIVRLAPTSYEADVPNWFKNRLSLKPPASTTSVTQGWHQLGNLTVQMHTGSVYQHFWTLAVAEAAWYTLMTLIAVYGVRLLLGWQLAPLNGILTMVENLGNQQFLKIQNPPKSAELKRLVNVLNKLSERLRQSYIDHSDTIQSLQQAQYQDELTGLANQRSWDRFLSEWMTSESFAPGWVLLLQIENLRTILRERGQQDADKLVVQLAMQLKHCPELNQEHVHLVHANGHEFWMFCPDPLDCAFTNRIENLLERTWQLSLVHQFKARLRAAALPIAQVAAPASIKHQVDLILHQARKQERDWVIGEADNLSVTNWVHWQQRLAKALKDRDIALFAQPLFSFNREVLQYEVHCRLLVDDSEPMMAGSFWPMVEELGLAPQFDRLVLESWIDNQEVMHKGGDWVVNLSGFSLASKDFRNWFEKKVPKAEVLQRVTLILEFSEYTLARADEDACNWLLKLTDWGIGLAVDQLGTSGQSFGFIARFPILQGKIERRHIRNIEVHPENALYVAGMANVLHSQQAVCFAEGVESEDEIKYLSNAKLDGVMGYALAHPSRLT